MANSIKLSIVAVLLAIVFTGCGGPRFSYNLYTNVPGTKVYCGFNKNDLKYCYTAPYSLKTNRSLGWSNKYFQGRAPGYHDSDIVKHPATSSVAWVRFNLKKKADFNDVRISTISNLKITGSKEIQSHEIKGFNGNIEKRTPNPGYTFLKVMGSTTDANYKQYSKVTLITQDGEYKSPFVYGSTYQTKGAGETTFYWIFSVKKGQKDFKVITQNNQALEVKLITLKEKVTALIDKQDIEGLKKLVDKDNEALNYIPNKKLKLALTGPKNLKITDLVKMKKKGMSEVLIIAQIKRVKSPYIEFTLDEIETLQELDLTDNIIAEMMNVTTKLKEDQERKAEQDRYIKQQNKVANTQPKVIYRDRPVQNNNNRNNNQSNPLLEKATDKLLEAGAKKLFDHLF